MPSHPLHIWLLPGTGAGSGFAFPIRTACCFKLKVRTHTHTYTLALEYFPCLQFWSPENFDLCLSGAGLGWAGPSAFLCIFIGFIQLPAFYGAQGRGQCELQILLIRRIARSQQIEFLFLLLGNSRTSLPARLHSLPKKCQMPTSVGIARDQLAAHERPITRTFHAAAAAAPGQRCTQFMT